MYKKYKNLKYTNSNHTQHWSSLKGILVKRCISWMWSNAIRCEICRYENDWWSILDWYSSSHLSRVGLEGQERCGIIVNINTLNYWYLCVTNERWNHSRQFVYLPPGVCGRGRVGGGGLSLAQSEKKLSQ